MRFEPDRIIVHQTGALWGDRQTIDAYHRAPRPRGRGWDEIGYHGVILNGSRYAGRYRREDDGLFELGRSWRRIGAHDHGENQLAWGLALVGRDVFTFRQLLELHAVVQGLRAASPRPLEVYGHCENEPEGAPVTECPGRRLAPRLELLRSWLADPFPDTRSPRGREFLAAVCFPRGADEEIAA